MGLPTELLRQEQFTKTDWVKLIVSAGVWAGPWLRSFTMPTIHDAIKSGLPYWRYNRNSDSDNKMDTQGIYRGYGYRHDLSATPNSQKWKYWGFTRRGNWILATIDIQTSPIVGSFSVAGEPRIEYAQSAEQVCEAVSPPEIWRAFHETAEDWLERSRMRYEETSEAVHQFQTWTDILLQHLAKSDSQAYRTLENIR